MFHSIMKLLSLWQIIDKNVQFIFERIDKANLLTGVFINGISTWPFKLLTTGKVCDDEQWSKTWEIPLLKLLVHTKKFCRDTFYSFFIPNLDMKTNRLTQFAIIKNLIKKCILNSSHLEQGHVAATLVTIIIPDIYGLIFFFNKITKIYYCF